MNIFIIYCAVNSLKVTWFARMLLFIVYCYKSSSVVNKFCYNLYVNLDESFYVLKQQEQNRFQSTCV